MKRVLFLLSALITVFMLTVFASAIDFEYEIYYDCSEVVIYEYTGSSTTVTVPSTIEGCTVVGIGAEAFAGTDIKKITLPSSITFIERDAFRGCTSLESITLPYSLEQLGEYAFHDCISLKSITVPANVEVIPDGCFANCNSLESVTLPANLRYIGFEAFWRCSSLKSVKIPRNVEEIRGRSFGLCTSLTSITVDNANPYFTVKNNCFGYSDDEGLVAIIATFGTPTIPNTVAEILDFAFSSSPSVTSVTIPESVMHVGEGAFAGCKSLASIKVDEDNPFYYAKNNCLIRDGEVVAGCKNSVIPEDVDEIGFAAFYGSSIKNITIPENIYFIRDWAFRDSALESITFGDDDVEIGQYAFSGCNFSTLNISPNLLLREFTFANCAKLTKVTFEEGCEEVAPGMFFECVNLAEVNLASTVRFIGDEAFSYCSSLKKINFNNAELEYFGKGAMRSCTSLESITLPGGYYDISDYAFMNCTALKKVEFSPNADVQFIGTLAFMVSGIEEIILPESVRTIGTGAFALCYNLKYVTLSRCLEYIGGLAFAYCRNLDEVVFNSFNTEFGEDAFLGCAPLTFICERESDAHIYAYHNNLSLEFMFDGFLYAEDYTGITLTKCIEKTYDVIFVPAQINGVPVVALGSKLFTDIPKNRTIIFDEFYDFYADGITIKSDTFTGMPAGTKICCLENSNTADILKAKGVSYVYYIGGQEYDGETDCNHYYEFCYSVSNGNATILGTLDIQYRNEIYIPESLNGHAVTKIADNAFADGFNVGLVKIPQTVTEIGAGAFMNCPLGNMYELIIPENVTKIGNNAFKNCNQLKSVYLQCANCTVNATAFENCTALEDFCIEGAQTTVNANLFKDCKNIKSMFFIDCANVVIDANAFENNDFLEDVDFNKCDNVTIGMGAFKNCANLGNARFYQNKNIVIGADAFENNSDFYIHFESDECEKISIGKNAFKSCTNTLQYIDFSAKTVSIGESAFENNNGFSYMYFADNADVTIGARAFANCTNLAQAFFYTSKLTIGTDAFKNCHEELTLYGISPNSSADSYATNNGIDVIYYKDGFEFYVENGEEILNDYSGEFASLSLNTFGKGKLKKISDYTFYDNEYLKEIRLGTNVETIESCAFMLCDNLKKVTILNNDISIAQNAFIQCHDDLMIVCKEGSNAHAYAVENNIRYELLPPVDFGDVDGNGNINIRDAATILQFIAGWDVEINESAADVDGSGNVNIRDAALILQYIAGWDVILGA